MIFHRGYRSLSSLDRMLPDSQIRFGSLQSLVLSDLITEFVAVLSCVERSESRLITFCFEVLSICQPV